MSETTRHDDEDVQAQDDPDGKYRHGASITPSVTRRGLLKAGAAAGAAAALPGQAVADHGGNDPIGINDDGTEEDEAHDGLANRPVRVAAGGTVAGAMTLTPLGPLAGAALGYDLANGEVDIDAAADYLFGEFIAGDSVDEQLQVDIRAHAGDVKNELNWTLKQLDNRLDLAENNWIAQSKFAFVQAVNAGKSKSECINAAEQAIFDAATPVQKSLLAIEEAAALRHVSFDAREDAADIQFDGSSDTSGKVTYFHQTEEVEGLVPLHVTLLNGETHETWAAYCKRTPNSSEPEREIAHSYTGADSGTPDLTLPNYTRMSEFVEEAAWDSDLSMDIVTDADGNKYEGLSSVIENYNVYDQAGNPLNMQPAFIEDWQASSPAEYSDLNGYVQREFFEFVETLRSEMATFASDAYDAIEEDEINVDKLVTPLVYGEELARDWATAGDTGHARSTLAYLGADSSLETSMDITVAETDAPSTTVTADSTDPLEYTDVSVINGGTVDVTVDHRAPRADTGDVVVQDGDESIEVRVTPYTDDESDPTYIVERVDVYVSSQAAAVESRVGRDGDGDAVAYIPHSDLDTDDTGDYTIESVDVVTVDTSGGTDTATVDSSVGVTTVINGHDYGITYEDAALATDWRPQDKDPDTGEKDVSRQSYRYEDYQFSSTSGSANIYLRIPYDSKDESVTPPEYTVPSSGAVELRAFGGSSTATKLHVTNDNGTTVTVDVTDETEKTIDHTTFDDNTSAAYQIEKIEIEYDDGSGPYTDTVDSGLTPKVLMSTDVELDRFDFLTDKWYTVVSSVDNAVSIVTSDGDWVPVHINDRIRIGEALDADGNQLDGVNLSDTNRHTLDTTRLQTELDRSVDAQQTIDDVTGGGGGGGGSSGGGGGSLSLEALGIGGGALGALYLYFKSGASGGGGRRRR